MTATTETPFAEATERQRQRAGDLLVGREVHACVSMMVDELLRANTLDSDLGFSFEDIENATEPHCPHCGEEAERGEFSEEWEAAGLASARELHYNLRCPANCMREAGEEGETLFDESDADHEPQEVYEWWIVDGFLAGNLEERGHPIYRGYGPAIWGRCCTGQAIALDRDIQAIAWGLTWIRETVLGEVTP